jgi:hypothetical protein
METLNKTWDFGFGLSKKQTRLQVFLCAWWKV